MSSTIKNEKIPGYREEEGVNPGSLTETYAALKSIATISPIDISLCIILFTKFGCKVIK